MKLADLRKLAIKKQQRIRFRLNNGMDCLMDERGVALVPGLDRVSDFNLEQELSAASSFSLEPLSTGKKDIPKPKMVTRDELAALVNASPAAAAHHDDHDDE
jgi:hypothetical protein